MDHGRDDMVAVSFAREKCAAGGQGHQRLSLSSLGCRPSRSQSARSRRSEGEVGVAQCFTKVCTLPSRDSCRGAAPTCLGSPTTTAAPPTTSRNRPRTAQKGNGGASKTRRLRSCASGSSSLLPLRLPYCLSLCAVPHLGHLDQLPAQKGRTVLNISFSDCVRSCHHGGPSSAPGHQGARVCRPGPRSADPAPHRGLPPLNPRGSLLSSPSSPCTELD